MLTFTKMHVFCSIFDSNSKVKGTAIISTHNYSRQNSTWASFT